MASFAAKTFAHNRYAAYRPSYPPELYSRILKYHRGPRRFALDIGTGHGVVARHLTQNFEAVAGSDVSEGMIATARALATETPNLSFHVASAESSPFVPDGELNLVTAAECAHWFDYGKFWPEMARVVQPGGTIAIWGYAYPSLIEFPRASRLIAEYSEQMDEKYLGPYWQNPGHQIIVDLFRAVVPPETDWSDIERTEYRPEEGDRNTGPDRWFMASRMTLGSMCNLMRTWSAYHEWSRRWPDRKQRVDGTQIGPGDLFDDMLDEMRQVEPALADRAREGSLLDVEVDLEFGSALVLARRKLP